MSLRALRKYWLALVIVICGALLVVLAGLQFAWTGQLSQAQTATMENSLFNSVRQFEQEVERELLFLLSVMRVEGLGGLTLDWNRAADGYAMWAETSAHAGLLSRILAFEAGPGGTEALHELPLGKAEPVPASWGPELHAVEDALSELGTRPGRGPRWPPTWTLVPDSMALVRPIVPLDRIRRGQPRSARGLPGYIILVVDWAYISEEMLPELVERLFSGANGERLYEVAITANGGADILYRSHPAIDADWLAGADITRRLRLFRGPQGRPDGPGGAPAGGLGAILRSAQEDSPIGGGAGPQAGLRLQGGGRGRVFAAGAITGFNLELAAAHVSGSLAGAVARQRARNLGLGLGVLLLLAGATALVVVSARMTNRLAAMQIEFIAGVTHELRTPLAVICSAGENLADGIVSSEEGAKRYGQLISSQARRLSEMVEDTLQVASLESGKRQFTLASVAPERALQRALDEARPMIEQAGFALETANSPDLPAVRADEGALQQILANLISNAVKYGDPGRWIRVEAERGAGDEGPEVQIRVRDRGRGIPSEERSRVFDAYFRGAGAGGVQGSGLGLKLARDLALGMGARLSLSSEPGRGSVFTLHLPVPADGED